MRLVLFLLLGICSLQAMDTQDPVASFLATNKRFPKHLYVQGLHGELIKDAAGRVLVDGEDFAGFITDTRHLSDKMRKDILNHAYALCAAELVLLPQGKLSLKDLQRLNALILKDILLDTYDRPADKNPDWYQPGALRTKFIYMPVYNAQEEKNRITLKEILVLTDLKKRLIASTTRCSELLKSCSEEMQKVWHTYRTMVVDHEDVPMRMRCLVRVLSARIEAKEDPYYIAAYAHREFSGVIHPFSDANGRTARLLMNILLQALGKPPIIFADVEDYITHLQGSSEVFAAYIRDGAQNFERHSSAPGFLTPSAAMMQKIAATYKTIDLDTPETAEAFVQVAREYFGLHAICICAQCGKSDELLRQAFSHCGKCKKIFYCDRECQVEHWKTHRAECKAIDKQEDGGKVC